MSRYITVNATLFAVAAMFAATRDVREYLCGVHIEKARRGRPGVIMTATNGHMLVAIHDPDGSTNGRHLVRRPPRPMTLAKTKTADPDCTWLHFDDQRVTLLQYPWTPESDDLPSITPIRAYDSEPMVNEFPPWLHLIPDEPAQGVAGFSPTYLQTFARAAKALESPCITVRLSTSGANIITFWDDARFFGMLMPIRMSDYDPDSPMLPDWIKKKAAQ